ncbi:MAG: hypothetical protein KUG81_05280 [Gammaproteobacteria bacterium]|nr:hypothetical protein [Gammaproteobacteria bacterium]
MKKYFIFLVLFSLSGCVSIEAPEHLVSDTVEASKDAYNAIKKKISTGDSEIDNLTFSHKHIPAGDESHAESTINCINGATDIARKELDVYKVDVVKTTTNKIVEKGRSTFECNIVVVDKYHRI